MILHKMNGILVSTKPTLFLGSESLLDLFKPSFCFSICIAIHVSCPLYFHFLSDWMLSKSKFAFSATRTNNVNVYARQTLIFDKVHTNMGNIYNPIFGHLTVPVNGTYSVGVKIVAQSGKTLDMYLMKDTEQVHRFYFGDTSNGHYEANTVNLILKLTRGNVLYVQGRNNPDHVGLESAFSSVLLFT